MQKAVPILNASENGGVFLVTSSVAGVGATGSSIPYSVTKAAGKAFSPFQKASSDGCSRPTPCEVPCFYTRAQDTRQCSVSRHINDRMGRRRNLNFKS